MNDIANLSRRGFLGISAAAGGGLLLGMYLPQLDRSARAAEAMPGEPHWNAFLRIGNDDSVTVIINKAEMGQGIHTALAMLVAEELDADWTKVRAENAPVAEVYKHTVFGVQLTGGSSSTWSEYERMRKAGATARALLLQAAATAWNVDPKNCSTNAGKVLHAATGRSFTFGQLADRAARLAPPEQVTLKEPNEFKLIGRPTKRLDTPAKTNGTAKFGIDVLVPGMLVAVVARPPVFGGKLIAFDDQEAKAVNGVRHVVAIDRGVAVVADGYWQAAKGRQALKVTWDDGDLAPWNSQQQQEEYRRLATKPGAVARNEGDAASVLHGSGTRQVTAMYEMPYLAHATMEPINCVADVRADHCDVWTGTQYQAADRDAAAEEANLKPEQVEVHTMMLGGGFGRRAAILDNHFVREAVQISKAVGAPVKVIWTREDDLRGGYYRPACCHALSAAVDDQGNPVAWHHRIVCQSIMEKTPFEAVLVKDGIDSTATEGAAELPYEIANIRVEWQKAPRTVPVQPCRSVGHSHNAFAVETFIDELAHAAGKDPVEFRLSLLKKHPHHQGVLRVAAEKGDWGRPLPSGHSRGVAVHESFGSVVAEVAEVSLAEGGRVVVHRVVCAVDCGPIVNPDTIAAQIESGIVFGLTSALYGEITLADGRVKQRNFHDYRMLRINEMPVVETHILPSSKQMGGVGEISVPPIAAAVANALFVLTGERIRSLPIQPQQRLRT